jgi:hypothetical protein
VENEVIKRSAISWRQACCGAVIVVALSCVWLLNKRTQVKVDVQLVDLAYSDLHRGISRPDGNHELLIARLLTRSALSDYHAGNNYFLLCLKQFKSDECAPGNISHIDVIDSIADVYIKIPKDCKMGHVWRFVKDADGDWQFNGKQGRWEFSALFDIFGSNWEQLGSGAKKEMNCLENCHPFFE